MRRLGRSSGYAVGGIGDLNTLHREYSNHVRIQADTGSGVTGWSYLVTGSIEIPAYVDGIFVDGIYRQNSTGEFEISKFDGTGFRASDPGWNFTDDSYYDVWFPLGFYEGNAGGDVVFDLVNSEDAPNLVTVSFSYVGDLVID